jgi:hypothetical protein
MKILRVMHQKMNLEFNSFSNNFEDLLKSAFGYVLKLLLNRQKIDVIFNTILGQVLPTVLLF